MKVRDGKFKILFICYRCSKHNSPTTSPSKSSDTSGTKSHSHHHHKHHKMTKYRMRTPAEQEAIRKQTNSILEKTIAVLQLTALAQFGCGSEHFYKNSLKNTTKGNHYGWVVHIKEKFNFQKKTKMTLWNIKLAAVKRKIEEAFEKFSTKLSIYLIFLQGPESSIRNGCRPHFGGLQPNRMYHRYRLHDH